MGVAGDDVDLQGHGDAVIVPWWSDGLEVDVGAVVPGGVVQTTREHRLFAVGWSLFLLALHHWTLTEVMCSGATSPPPTIAARTLTLPHCSLDGQPSPT